MAVWLLRTQAVLVVVGAIAAVLLAGTGSGLALLAGGGIGILLTAVAALRTGVVSARAGAATMVAAFYRAMAMKLVVAVALFAAVAYWFPGFFGPVLIGYIATVVAYWLAMWRLGRMQPASNQQDD
nr:ATP synthase subunit I [Wenzhouxiangella sp. XN79A]